MSEIEFPILATLTYIYGKNESKRKKFTLALFTSDL